MVVRERARGIPRPALRKRGALFVVMGQIGSDVEDGEDIGGWMVEVGIAVVVVVVCGRKVALFQATVLELELQQEPFRPIAVQHEKLLHGVTIATSPSAAAISHQR